MASAARLGRLLAFGNWPKEGEMGERGCGEMICPSASAERSRLGVGEKKSQTFWPGRSRLAMMWVKERTSLVDWRGSRGGFLSRKVWGGFWREEGECSAAMAVCSELFRFYWVYDAA